MLAITLYRFFVIVRDDSIEPSSAKFIQNDLIVGELKPPIKLVNPFITLLIISVSDESLITIPYDAEVLPFNVLPCATQGPLPEIEIPFRQSIIELPEKSF